MHSSVILALGFGSLAAAMTCTEGRPWTPEEYAEFMTLSNTTGWAPMAKIKHCTFGETDFISVPKLEARGGENRWVGFDSSNCPNDRARCVGRQLWLGGCYTSDKILLSGYLWREKTEGAYPTVAYFEGSNCSGKVVHSQGILSGRFSLCDGLGPFSALLESPHTELETSKGTSLVIDDYP
ncbi:hypothetical protein B0T26DRAFT_673548 [Lasiosphaeria miniovina]|uniref:Uncharacterized protein n=1 Tax=Lasiosphaeria miniovina TaxID=1954250 RepID=A0AA40DZ10_9PEZI|nr:uncharacterized protein B0T26DRAFT_673548 [Lasiosphaeria miniovina]KAK0721759.1 hypothetical protein B0T26DRAFT_673548 [Lasiosphaeria miniovina]